jgi:CSLREA domain-containing protein
VSHFSLSTRVSSIAFALVALTAPRTSAIEVTTTVDENGTNPAACALREAVRTINEQAGIGGCVFTAGDTLVELGAGVYQLSLNLGTIDRVAVTRAMTIRGQGPAFTAVEPSGPHNDDLFLVVLGAPGTVTVEGLSLRGVSGGFNGPLHFLARSGSVLVVRDVAFLDNHAADAPLFVDGTGDGVAHLERVVFENNTNTFQSVGTFGGGSGGGISCFSNDDPAPLVTLLDVTFRNNSALGANDEIRGGAIGFEGCNLALENVTFEGNSAVSSAAGGGAAGGGLAIVNDRNDVEVSLTNVTFFGNTAELGGGLYQDEAAVLGSVVLTLSNVTFADNMASVSGDHYYQEAGEAFVRNVLFGPSGGDDCSGTPGPVLTLLGGNMDSDASCGVEQTEVDPGLASALVSNGGFTQTVALIPGAAAIDAGTNTGCSGFDQRGAARPFDGDADQAAQCDIGAYERAPLVIFADSFESSGTGAWSASVPFG